MTRTQQVRNFFARGGSGTDKELAIVFNTEPYVIRGYISSMNKRQPGLIDKRVVPGQRKQEYYQPNRNKAVRSPSVRVAPTLSITINGTLYRAIPIQ
jgi:hypothetical protein